MPGNLHVGAICDRGGTGPCQWIRPCSQNIPAAMQWERRSPGWRLGKSAGARRDSSSNSPSGKGPNDKGLNDKGAQVIKLR